MELAHRPRIVGTSARVVHRPSLLRLDGDPHICLSKGLGAPIGSVVATDAKRMGRLRRIRKMLGGGMRQAGILAAACEYALENNIARLQDDHDNALRLAQGLADVPGISCDAAAVQTNMVYIVFEDETRVKPFTDYLAEHGVIVIGGQVMRLVTHLDISNDAIEKTIALAEGFFG